MPCSASPCGCGSGGPPALLAGHCVTVLSWVVLSAGTDELQQQQHRRALSNMDDRSSAAVAAAAGGNAPTQQQQGQQQQQTRAEWLQEKCLDLLLVLAHADSVVKGLMCSKDNLQHLLDLTQKLRSPAFIKVRLLPWISHCADYGDGALMGMHVVFGRNVGDSDTVWRSLTEPAASIAHYRAVAAITYSCLLSSCPVLRRP